jgi:hypothetical protein
MNLNSQTTVLRSMSSAIEDGETEVESPHLYTSDFTTCYLRARWSDLKLQGSLKWSDNRTFEISRRQWAEQSRIRSVPARRWQAYCHLASPVPGDHWIWSILGERCTPLIIISVSVCRTEQVKTRRTQLPIKRVVARLFFFSSLIIEVAECKLSSNRAQGGLLCGSKLTWVYIIPSSRLL